MARIQRADVGRKLWRACVALHRGLGFAGAGAYLLALPIDVAEAGGQPPLPSGGVVVPGSGAATIVQPNASTLNVNQSTNKAIINWNSFSVGHGDTVNFNQPGASSATLNRVTGATPSWVAGTINAPGTVLLVNPNGVEITKSGVITTGSFAASTLDIKNSDFLKGKYTFTGDGGSAAVVNNGRINVSDGGFAALLGGQVANNGIISARLGSVALGAGEQATLDLSGDGFLSVAVPSSEMGKLVDANGALVSNKGKIVASGGQVYLSAATAANVLRSAVNIPGAVRVNTVGVHNGRIVINGGAGGAVSVSGRLAANGGRRHKGGLIAVAGRNVNVSGKAAANGASGGAISLIGGDQLALSGALTAKGKSGQGGEVDVTAANVALIGTMVDASGGTGGGNINIGGGPHAMVALAGAQSLLIDENSIIRADATANGSGGHIVVWSDGSTTAQGTFTARGGPNGGNGGLIETSGETLDLTGVNVTTAAALGTTGTWLLDPFAVTIGHCTSSCGSLPATNPVGGDSTLNDFEIDAALASNSVVISTGTANSGTAGSITLNSNATLTWTSTNTLTLNATNATSGSLQSGAITLSGAINAANGGLILTAGTTAPDGSITDTGSLNVASFTLNAGNWSQNYSSLTNANNSSNAFSATNFVLSGGTSYRPVGSGNGFRGLAISDLRRLWLAGRQHILQ